MNATRAAETGVGCLESLLPRHSVIPCQCGNAMAAQPPLPPECLGHSAHLQDTWHNNWATQHGTWPNLFKVWLAHNYARTLHQCLSVAVLLCYSAVCTLQAVQSC